VNWHDPYVLEDDGTYYAFICTHPKESPPDTGGTIAYLTSTDLGNWQTEDYKILYQSDEYYLAEVPQVFWRRMNDQKHWRLYLLFSPRWSPLFNQPIPMGITFYVRSVEIVSRRSVSYDNIPWESEPANQLVVGSHAGKFIDPEAACPVFFGFQYEDEKGNFVGALTDPQWGIFDDDGKIHLSDINPQS
jgi:beta-fructofuranosidase